MKEKTGKKKVTELAYTAFLFAALVLGGAACASASQPPGAPQSQAPVAVQVQTPHDQLVAWRDGPGGQAFGKVAAEWPDTTSVTDMTPVQMSQLIKDIHAAKAYPVPASVDPGGYYTDALMHLEKGMTALQNASPFTAIFQMQAGLDSVKHFTAEVKKIA